MNTYQYGSLFGADANTWTQQLTQLRQGCLQIVNLLGHEHAAIYADAVDACNFLLGEQVDMTVPNLHQRFLVYDTILALFPCHAHESSPFVMRVRYEREFVRMMLLNPIRYENATQEPGTAAASDQEQAALDLSAASIHAQELGAQEIGAVMTGADIFGFQALSAAIVGAYRHGSAMIGVHGLGGYRFGVSMSGPQQTVVNVASGTNRVISQAPDTTSSGVCVSNAANVANVSSSRDVNQNAPVATKSSTSARGCKRQKK